MMYPANLTKHRLINTTFTIIIGLIVILSINKPVQAQQIPPFEVQALEALYYSTNGSNWLIDAGWLVDPDPCTWYGGKSLFPTGIEPGLKRWVGNRLVAAAAIGECAAKKFFGAVCFNPTGEFFDRSHAES